MAVPRGCHSQNAKISVSGGSQSVDSTCCSFEKNMPQDATGLKRSNLLCSIYQNHCCHINGKSMK